MKYIAEFMPLMLPKEVAQDTAIYNRPVTLASADLVSGSQIILLKTFGVLPGSTGPACNPWNLCIVLAKDSSKGMNVHWQHLNWQETEIVGIGTSFASVNEWFSDSLVI